MLVLSCDIHTHTPAQKKKYKPHTVHICYLLFTTMFYVQAGMGMGMDGTAHLLPHHLAII